MPEISLEKVSLCNDIDRICARLEHIVKQYRAAAEYVKAGNQGFGCRMVAAAYHNFEKLAAELDDAEAGQD